MQVESARALQPTRQRPNGSAAGSPRQDGYADSLRSTLVAPGSKMGAFQRCKVGFAALATLRYPHRSLLIRQPRRRIKSRLLHLVRANQLGRLISQEP